MSKIFVRSVSSPEPLTILGGSREQRLLDSVKARAHEHPRRTEHQRGGKASPTRDAAGRHHRNVTPQRRYRIHHRRDQWQSRTERTVSTRFAALRDDDVGAFLKHLARLCKRLDLANYRNACRFDPSHERRGVPKREHDRHRCVRECTVEQLGLLGEPPGDKTATYTLVSGGDEFPPQPFGIIAASAD
jgi:hypothetical protein